MNQSKEKMLEAIKSQTFGVEIEMYGLARNEIAELVAKYFGTESEFDGYAYNHDSCNLESYTIKDSLDREWHVVRDSSIYNPIYDSYGVLTRKDWDEAGELVTPVLNYKDIELLQELVRFLKSKGLKSGKAGGCGVHIHVGANFNQENGHTIKTLINYANLVKNHQNLIKNAIQFSSERNHWAGNINDKFIKTINDRHFKKTYSQLEKAWYHSVNLSIPMRADHYNDSRYQLMNLHGFFNKHRIGKDNQMTIEFRCFEFKENMHAGKLKAWIQLVLAMSAYSKNVNYVKRQEIEIYNNPKNSMKNWLLNMGLVGDEFKTCRELLMRYLEGDSASRTPRTHTPRNQRIDNLEI